MEPAQTETSPSFIPWPPHSVSAAFTRTSRSLSSDCNSFLPGIPEDFPLSRLLPFSLSPNTPILPLFESRRLFAIAIPDSIGADRSRRMTNTLSTFAGPSSILRPRRDLSGRHHRPRARTPFPLHVGPPHASRRLLERPPSAARHLRARHLLRSERRRFRWSQRPARPGGPEDHVENARAQQY